MVDPIIFISRNRVKKGLFADFKDHYQNSIPQTEKEKPGTFVQLAYVDEDAAELTIVRFFFNSEGFDQQLAGADERSKITYRFIEPTRIEIYGEPSQYALDMMRKVAGSGIVVDIYPQFIGGFIRNGNLR